MVERKTTTDLQTSCLLTKDPATPAASIADTLTRAAPRHGTGDYFGNLVQQRMGRRSFLKGAGTFGTYLVLTPALLKLNKAQAREGNSQLLDPGNRITSTPIAPSFADGVIVPQGYSYNVLLRWGDPLFPEAPEFDATNQTGARQARQFGFNCDFIGYYVLPQWFRVGVVLLGQPTPAMLLALGASLPFGPQSSVQALLFANHEYTTGGDMFPSYDGDNPTQDQVETEIAAHGASIAEIVRQSDGPWQFDRSSPFNRRITGSSEIELTGPLAGHALLQTSTGPTGRRVLGMLNTCAGGKTPWGTVLTCEENFDQYFANFAQLQAADPAKAALYQRISPEDGETRRKWERFDSRFDVAQEPKEYARFGYVVEIDPYDPRALPKKRTALGRFKHEGAVPAITRGRRVAIYSGDDARFEYVYKFITQGLFDPNARADNLQLLDQGTLYVAKFNADGTGEWRPLVHGQGPLTADNGFPSQIEILLNARGAADLLEATKMDRPEDIAVSPTSGAVYITFTNNTQCSGPSGNPGEDAANPRTPNPHGHLIEPIEDEGDHGALTFRWAIFTLCGDPSNPDHGTFFSGFDQGPVSPIANPDNRVFDDDGNLWIATDGQPGAEDFGWNDGIFAVPTQGPDRGFLRQFLSAVPGLRSVAQSSPEIT